MRKHFPSRPRRGERDDIIEEFRHSRHVRMSGMIPITALDQENKVESAVRAPWILAGVQPRLFGRAVQ